MLRTRLALVVFACAACGTGFTQLTNQLRPVTLRLVVTYEDRLTKVRDATVELMDSVGNSSALNRKFTDQDGRVEFNTLTGYHRIRISGPEMYPYEGDFEIMPSENFHIESIRVRRRLDAQAPVVEGKNSVPMIRLKIPDKARKQFEEGSRAMEEKRWPESRKHFQAAVDLYADYDLAYNGLGVACSEMHDLPAAKQAFQKAVALNDKFAGAERNLGRIMLSEHNYEEAASLLNRSLAVESKNAWALTHAAYAELQLHRYKEAAEHALQVHALPHQELANAHAVAAYALDALGRQPEAILQWKLYLKEDPKGPNAQRAQNELLRLTKSPQS
jgi:hypothetical protein